MDYAGAIKALCALGGVGVVVWFLVRVARSGRMEQRNDELEAQARGQDEAFEAGEEWDAAGGLRGAARRVSDGDD